MLLRKFGLRIIRNNSKKYLVCDECEKTTIHLRSVEFLKRYVNEHGWKYDYDNDNVYCFECTETLVTKKEVKDVSKV